MKDKIKNKIKYFYEDHLYRNAAYLIANTVVMAISGFVFWMVAAVFYSETEVGLGVTMISALQLLALFSILGFNFGLIRFLPRAKNKINMINSCFTLSGIAAVFFSILFLILLNILSPKLLFIKENYILSVIFILFVLIWIINSLLTFVFIAFRTAKYMFIKNLFFNILRIPALLIFISYGAFGILSSFGIATLISTVIAFAFFIPNVIKNYKLKILVKKKVILEMFHFSSGNYVASLFAQSPALILPLIITHIISPEMTAYFYMPWMIVNILFMFAMSISQSLLAEGSHNDKELFKLIMKAIRFTLLILILGIVGILLIGNQILLFFGEGYVEQGLSLLYLLTLSSILFGINTIYLTIKNIKKEIKTLVIANGIIAFVTLLTAYLFLERYGIIAAGIGWIIGNLIVTLIGIFDMRKNIFKFIKF